MGDNKLSLASMEDLREVCLGKAGIKINGELVELKKLYEDSKARERYWKEKLDERVDAEAYKKLEEKYEKLKKDYAQLASDPYLLDSLQKQCNELIGKNAALESIEERYDSLMKRYMDLDRKYGALRDENGALQHVIKDLDRDSSCGNCMFKKYYAMRAEMRNGAIWPDRVTIEEMFERAKNGERIRLNSTSGKEREEGYSLDSGDYSDILAREIIKKVTTVKIISVSAFFFGGILIPISTHNPLWATLLLISLVIGLLVPSEASMREFYWAYKKEIKKNEQ